MPAGDLDLRRDRRRGGRRGLRALVALRRPSGRGARRLLRERGRRRPAGDRRAPGLPLRDRREDELAVRPPRARAQRPRVHAGNRRQRTRARGAAHRAAGGVPAEDRGRCPRPMPSSGSSGTSPTPSELDARRSARDRRADARARDLADDHRGVQADERHPRALRRSSATAVCCPGETQAEAEAEIRAALGEDNYDFVWVEGVGGTRVAARHAALARDRELRRGGGAGRRACARSSTPGSPTATSCARPSGRSAYGFFPMRAMESEVAAALDPLRRRADPGGRPRARNPLPHARGTYTRRVSRDKVRLGGMALANGVLVHGPRYWACAVRTEDGELEVASGLKPLRASEIENRLIRGPARMAEIFALLPEIRRRLPAAQLPFQRPAVVGGHGRECGCGAPRPRQQALHRCAGDRSRPPWRVGPAAVALRGSNLAAYHGAEHISIGTYEHGEKRAKEHERCGSHLTRPAARSPRRSETRSPRGRRRLCVPLLAWRPGVGALAASVRALLLDGAEREEPARPGARDAGPRAPAPLRHRRAHARAARGREPRSGRMRPPRICCKWRPTEQRRKRLPPEIFDLPVEKMREG